MDLRDYFDSLADEELLRRVAARGLTDEALALALAELARRGLPDPRTPDEPPSPQPAESVELVFLAQGLPAGDAQSLAGALHQAGIPYSHGRVRHTLVGYRATEVHADLLVRPEHLAAARAAVEAFRRGDLAIDESFDPSVDG